MANLDLYERVRKVPDNAKKTIEAGRTKGFTDINPMWRIKVLTEEFGACGQGWYIEVIDKRLEWDSEKPNGEVSCFVDINLYVKYGDEWSKPIFGTGGASFVTVEKSGRVYQSDECYKMAYTDAISVACKALGIGADVYWDKDRTKYSAKEGTPQKAASNPYEAQIMAELKRTGIGLKSLLASYGVTGLAYMTEEQSRECVEKLKTKPNKEG